MDSQRVLPRILARTEEDCRHALARDLLRICHEHGPQRVGRAIACDEKTIRNARDERASLKLHNALNLLVLDEGALDSVLAEYGYELVRRPAGADERHATADCSRPIPHLALAQAPDSDGGTDLTDRELLPMESDIRASHRMTGQLIARIDAYRERGEAEGVRFGGTTYAAAQTDDPANRETHDFYPTWPAATAALLTVERFDGPIWEPACGDGAMSRVLESAGHEVISTDLIDRGYGEGGRDFLMQWTALAPNIVTNPPFRWAVEFTDRALQLTTGKVALLLRLAFLEGIERGLWFPQTPLARVWVMSRRVPIQRGRLHEDGDSGGVMAFAWFVWDHAHNGAPSLGWLDWKSA